MLNYIFEFCSFIFIMLVFSVTQATLMNKVFDAIGDYYE